MGGPFLHRSPGGGGTQSFEITWNVFPLEAVEEKLPKLDTKRIQKMDIIYLIFFKLIKSRQIFQNGIKSASCKSFRSRFTARKSSRFGGAKPHFRPYIVHKLFPSDP